MVAWRVEDAEGGAGWEAEGNVFFARGRGEEVFARER